MPPEQLYAPIQTHADRLRTTAPLRQVAEEEWYGNTLFPFASLSAISGTL